MDEITEQVRRNTGLSVTDIQIERVLNGQSCSMDPAAKEIIVRQGRLYTEKILSAIMEAGFDLKAIPSVIMGGGASILKRHVTPQDGLCRQIYLTDVHANASGYERIVGADVREVKRPVFSFRLNLDNPDHKKGMGDPAKCSRWTEEQLSGSGDLKKIRKNNQLEKSIRQAIREELAGVSISGSGESVSKKEEIPSQMLDFLSGLEDAF